MPRKKSRERKQKRKRHIQRLTFSWLKASILFMAVSKAVMESRKAWSCSHSGLLSRSPEIFTAALDMADKKTQTIKRMLFSIGDIRQKKMIILIKPLFLSNAVFLVAFVCGLHQRLKHHQSISV